MAAQVDDTFIFINLDFNNRPHLSKYITPLLERVSKEKAKRLVPSLNDPIWFQERNHRFFCFNHKKCSCPLATPKYHRLNSVLSDRRPAKFDDPNAYSGRFMQHWNPDTDKMYMWNELDTNGTPIPHPDSDCIIAARNERIPWAHTTPDVFQTLSSWNPDWDCVSVSQPYHSGVTLWSPIGNGLYEWAHTMGYSDGYSDSTISLTTGIERIVWNGSKGTFLKSTK